MAEYDPVGMLRVLTKHNVDFVVVGGVAARLQGAPILTEDLDVTPKTSPQNLASLSVALDELDAKLRTATEPDGVAFPHDPQLLGAAQQWTLVTRLGDLDLVLQPSGTRGYEDLRVDANALTVATKPLLKVLVASLADVIRSKQAAGRAKDLAALPMLRLTLAEIERER